MEKYKQLGFKWEMNKVEKAFVDYLLENNYNISNVKQLSTKTKLDIEKDGITLPYELYSNYHNVEYVIEFFNKNFELTKKIEEHEKKN